MLSTSILTYFSIMLRLVSFYVVISLRQDDKRTTRTTYIIIHSQKQIYKFTNLIYKFTMYRYVEIMKFTFCFTTDIYLESMQKVLKIYGKD